jgi:DNA-binding response OmpR family regulator
MITDPHILYIEDELPMLEIARLALKISGYELSVATSGQQGLTMIRQRKPDVLLLDLMMRDLNGWDIYREIKSDARLVDIPVIVVTAKGPERHRRLIDDLPPVDEYITKPFDIDRLIRSVESYLH